MPDSSGSGKPVDLIYTADNNTDGSIAGTLDTVVPGATASASDATAYVHQCLMVRAIFFRPIFGSVAVSYAASAIIPASRFAPNIEFGSAEAMQQAAAVIRAYLQPRVALIGPRGKWHDTAYAEGDLDSFAAQGYAAHWPTILADFNNVDGQRTDLINEGISLSTENPRLEIRCLWLSVQHGAAFDQNQTGLGRLEKTGNRGNIAQKEDVIDAGGAGAAVWTMTASVHQLVDLAIGTADWDTDIVEFGTISETVTIPVVGADVTNEKPDQPPVLRGMDSMEQTGKSATPGVGFWFKEGSLFDEDVAADIIYETTHFIECSGMTETETLRPSRLKLNMDLDNFIDPVKVGASTATLESRLRLTLVSCTVVEHPVAP
jgi:hypothetical protein